MSFLHIQILFCIFQLSVIICLKIIIDFLLNYYKYYMLNCIVGLRYTIQLMIYSLCRFLKRTNSVILV